MYIYIMIAWVKVYEIVKTGNNLKARNQLYFICKYDSIFFQNKFCFKTKLSPMYLCVYI